MVRRAFFEPVTRDEDKSQSNHGVLVVIISYIAIVLLAITLFKVCVAVADYYKNETVTREE